MTCTRLLTRPTSPVRIMVNPIQGLPQGQAHGYGNHHVSSRPYAREMVGLGVRSRVVGVLLSFGVAAPILYFGSQLACGLMTDQYSFLRNAASDLGTANQPYHQAFNGAAILTGCSLLSGAVGLLLICARRIARRFATVVVAICCLSNGLAALSAGLFPLPDARHGGGVLGAGLFLTPFAVAFALWNRSRLRAYLVINVALFVAGGTILSTGSQSLAGLGQRLLAGAVFPSLGFICALMVKGLLETSQP
jgi:hypothetical membrane protein